MLVPKFQQNQELRFILCNMPEIKLAPLLFQNISTFSISPTE